MVQDKNTELLQQLIKATKEGKVTWRPTAKLNEFTSAFKGRFSILIGEETGTRYYFRLRDIDGRELLTLFHPFWVPPPDLVSSIENPSKETEVRVPPAHVPLPGSAPNVRMPPEELQVHDSPLVRELYRLASRSDWQAEQAIDSILQELKQ